MNWKEDKKDLHQVQTEFSEYGVMVNHRVSQSGGFVCRIEIPFLGSLENQCCVFLIYVVAFIRHVI